jgi:prephenate dehydrogenase
MTSKEDFVLVLGAGLTGQSVGRYLGDKKYFFFLIQESKLIYLKIF